jgi:hypothetical protein
MFVSQGVEAAWSQRIGSVWNTRVAA